MKNQIVKSVFLGFSLIELMIVIVIIGVLTTVAIPSYQAYIRSSRTSEAQANISSIAQYEEQYYSENNKYLGLGGNPATIPYPGDTAGGTIAWSTADANWSELGTIFTNNTFVRFQYRVYAGQFDQSGTDPATPLSTHVKSVTAMGLNNGAGPSGFPNPPVIATGTSCNGNLNATYPQSTFGITPAPYANWFLVVALGNQYWSSTGSNRNKCSLFVKANDRPAIFKQDDTE